MKKLLPAFGPVLRRLRLEKGLSQEELAAQLGISHSHISRLESGHKKPNMEMLFRIAAELGVNSSEIIAAMEEWQKTHP